MKNWSNIFFLVLVATATITPFIFQFVPGLSFLDSQLPKKVRENRRLAKKPVLNMKSLKHYPKKFEKYWDDRFPTRATLISLNRYGLVKYFRRSPTKKTIIGSKSRLFFNISTYQAGSFKEKELASFVSNLQKVISILNGLGVKVLFVITPNAQSIYPEEIPLDKRQKTSKSRLDQINEKMAAVDLGPNAKYLDLKKYLKSMKDEYKLYFDTDSHWNHISGYLVTQEIVKAARDWYPDLTTYPPDRINIRIVDGGRGDLGRMLGDIWERERVELVSYKEDPCKGKPALKKIARYIPDESFKQFHGPKAKWNKAFSAVCNEKKPVIAVNRDSFGSILFPHLLRSFGPVYMSKDRSNKAASIIPNKETKIVILQVVERTLVKYSKRIKWILNSLSKSNLKT